MIRMKLKELIKSRGMPMLILSEKAGISYPTVIRICNNNLSRIDFPTLNSICKALDCTPSDIIEYIKDDEGEKNETGTAEKTPRE